MTENIFSNESKSDNNSTLGNVNNFNSNKSNDGRVKEVIVDARINKILAMRTDSAAMLEALDAISEFYVVNSIEARRALRQDLELQNIHLGKKFLVEFDKVKEKILSVESAAIQFESCCNELAKKVSDADTNMKSFMEKATQLETQKNFCIEQANEISNFLSQFQLSSEEVDILYRSSLDQPKSVQAFFTSLNRLGVAYKDCKLMIEKHSYTAGFELLDVLSQHQNTAYRRLFEWVKGKCESLENSTTVDDIDTILQVAIKYLRKLPIYYSQCQDLVINSRRGQLVHRFVLALTQGGPAGQLYRAIDLHANDSIKYISDMLAWMHQTLASEYEFLQVVFGSDTSNVNEENDTESGGDERLQGLSLNELIARCVQGLGRPLRVRISQTLEAYQPIETLYSILDVLAFYEAIFQRLVPIENAVHSATKGSFLECKRLFTSALNRQADALIQSPSSYPLDLTASHSTKDCAKQMHLIVKAYSSALSDFVIGSNVADSVKLQGSNENIAADEGCSLPDILRSIIQPVLQSCKLSGQALSPCDMAIFMLNNISTIQFELKQVKRGTRDVDISFWFNYIAMESDSWINSLVNEEASRTLRRSDMDKILDLATVIPEGLIASEQPGLGQDRVGTVMRAFYASLFSTVNPHFDKLIDSELRELTRKLTAQSIANAHTKVYNLINLDSNQYDKSILSHTIEEVKVILGC